jgi:hypothetical protein
MEHEERPDMPETFPSAPGGEVPVPLARDTPPPPGYVDPLEGSEVLDDLVALESDAESEPTGHRRPMPTE